MKNNKFFKIEEELQRKIEKMEKYGIPPEKVWQILAEDKKEEVELKKKIKGYFYRSFVLFFSFLFLVPFFLVVIYYNIGKIGSDLPATTRFIVSLGSFIEENGFFLFVALAFLILAGFFLLKLLFIEKNNLPLISVLFEKINVNNITRQLKFLILSGVSIEKSLKIVADLSESIYYKEALEKASKEIKKGSSFLKALNSFYPKELEDILNKNNNIQGFLNKASNIFKEDLLRISKSASQILEVFLMVLMGGSAALFFISLMQPILID